jgi:hypothetical protein
MLVNKANKSRDHLFLHHSPALRATARLTSMHMQPNNAELRTRQFKAGWGKFHIPCALQPWPSQQKITPRWRGAGAELNPHVPPPTSSVPKNQDIALRATNLIKWCCLSSRTKGGEKTLCQQWRVTKVKGCGRKWGEAKEQFTSDARSTLVFSDFLLLVSRYNQLTCVKSNLTESWEEKLHSDLNFTAFWWLPKSEAIFRHNPQAANFS